MDFSFYFTTCLILALTVFDFLREKIKLSDTDARHDAKEYAAAEEKYRAEIRINVSEEIR